MSQPIPGSPDSGQGVPVCYRHPGRETYIRCQRCDRPICPECMRDAAVGFQCVECVKEGAKETRSGRTAYGGLRPTDGTATTVGLIVAQRRRLDRDLRLRRLQQQDLRLARAAAQGLLPARLRPAVRDRRPRLRPRWAGLPRRLRRRLLAAGHLDVHPRRHLAHRLQHVRAVGPRPAARGRGGPGAVPGPLLPLRPGRLRPGAVGGSGVRRHPRRLGRDLRPHGRARWSMAIKVGGDVTGIADLDRDQRSSSPCCSSTTSRGRDTWAASLGGLAAAASSSTRRGARGVRRSRSPGSPA